MISLTKVPFLYDFTLIPITDCSHLHGSERKRTTASVEMKAFWKRQLCVGEAPE